MMRHATTPRRRLAGLVGLVGLAGLALAGCDLDVENPNALPEDEALVSAEGLLATTVGLQDLFAEEVEEFIQASALVTDEWGTGTRSLLSYRTLLVGEGLDADFGVVVEPWRAAYRVINQADAVLRSVDAAGLPAGQARGVTAVARTLRAMAFGQLALQYERAILNPDAAAPTLSPRAEVLNTAITQLEQARTDVAALSAADLEFLNARVLGSGFDLPSTVDAMLARYYLEAEQYQQAADAAARVDLAVTSVFPYSGTDTNPVCNLSECGLLYVFPLASFVAEAEPGDQRPAFWVDVEATPFTGNPDSLLLPLNAYGGRNDDFLVYVPDEMTLIRAEAAARLGELETARELINEVRTRPTVPPVAGLPPLSEDELDTLGSILRQIAYERAYELYEQGLRWPDTRRLDAYIQVEPTYEFLPVPQQECQRQPSLGC